MKIILFQISLIALFISCCYAGCMTNIGGCPLGRKNGESWVERCRNCTCSGQTYEPTTLCYLPSEKLSKMINLHIVNYDSTNVEADVQQTGCPRGFVEVNTADMYNIKAELILAFAPYPVGGGYGCCDIYGRPTGIHKKCKAVQVGCEWEVVRIANPNLPCHVPPTGMVGK